MLKPLAYCFTLYPYSQQGWFFSVVGERVKSRKEPQSIRNKPFSEILVLGVITGAGFLSNEWVILKKIPYIQLTQPMLAKRTIVALYICTWNRICIRGIGLPYV